MNGNLNGKNWINKHMIDILNQDEQEIKNDLIEKTKKTGGKIYKYYSFEKDSNGDNYTLNNLKEGIIHFSEPENFNDPFDCILGASAEDMAINAMNEIYKMNIDIGNNFFKSTGGLLQGMLNFNEEKSKEYDGLLKFINNLMSNVETKKIVDKAIECKELNEEDEAKIFDELLKDREIFESVIKLISSKELEQIPDYYTIISEYKDDIIEIKKWAEKALNVKVEKEGNFESIEKVDCYNNNKVERLQDFCNIAGLNIDVKEEISKIKPLFREIIDDWKKKINNTYAITCFSTIPDNILMWSHYANKHRGICVEYDLNKCGLKEQNMLLGLFPVEYKNLRPNIPMNIFNFDDLTKLSFKNDVASIIALMRILFVKYKKWEYEKEWRSIVVKENLDENYNLKTDIISAVYLGVNIDKEQELLVRNICNEKDIPVRKYDIDIGEYKLIL